MKTERPLHEHARRTVTADGTSIAWRSSGGPAAPAVVLMHSLGSNHAMWAPQVEALSPRFHVIAAGFAPTSGYSPFLTGDSIGS